MIISWNGMKTNRLVMWYRSDGENNKMQNRNLLCSDKALIDCIKLWCFKQNQFHINIFIWRICRFSPSSSPSLCFHSVSSRLIVRSFTRSFRLPFGRFACDALRRGICVFGKSTSTSSFLNAPSCVPVECRMPSLHIWIITIETLWFFKHLIWLRFDLNSACVEWSRNAR